MAVLLQLVILGASMCMAASHVPHIVIITADDIGYNDFGFNKDGSSSKSHTPKLDEYARESIVLKDYYVMPNGRSTRSALLTGVHPASLGTQFDNNDKTSQSALTPDVQLLPQYLKRLDYQTHAVGQWDLGFQSGEFLPTSRGFDTFFGQYLSYGGYNNYEHISQAGKKGRDLHDDKADFQNRQCVSHEEVEVSIFKPELYAQRAVDIINNHDKSKPLFLYVAFQAAQIHTDNIKDLCDTEGEIPNDLLRDISETDSLRRCYLGLVSAVDRGFGRIMQMLTRKMFLQNTIVIFTSTSGGPSASPNYNTASNAPYRGSKGTGWEAGVKGSAFIYMTGWQKGKSDCLFHVTDWIPTIFSIYKDVTASDDLSKEPAEIEQLYGVSQFECLYETDSSNARDSIVHFLYGRSVSLVSGDYKLVLDNSRYLEMDATSEWYGEDSTATTCKQSGELCRSANGYCLYNLKDDPCEKDNLVTKEPAKLNQLKDIMNRFNQTVNYKPSLTSNSGDETVFTQGGCWAPVLNKTARCNPNGIALLLWAICVFTTAHIFLT